MSVIGAILPLALYGTISIGARQRTGCVNHRTFFAVGFVSGLRRRRAAQVAPCVRSRDTVALTPHRVLKPPPLSPNQC